MKTLRKESTVKMISTLVLSVVFFSSSLFAQPTFSVNEEINEEEINIENWMTNYDSFCEATIEYSEEELEIDTWMTDLNEFSNVLAIEDNEDLLAIEDWMLNYDTFTGVDEEPLLAIENWMTDYDAFASVNPTYFLAEAVEDNLDVEVWMTNLEAFNTQPANYIPSIETIEFDKPDSGLIALHIVK